MKSPSLPENLPACAEPDARALRDKVYGSNSTDANWEACKNGWMKMAAIKWMIEHSFQLP